MAQFLCPTLTASLVLKGLEELVAIVRCEEHASVAEVTALICSTQVALCLICKLTGAACQELLHRAPVADPYGEGKSPLGWCES